MTPEEQIEKKLNEYAQHYGDYLLNGATYAYSAKDFTQKILSIKVSKKVAECPECHGSGEYCPIVKDCEKRTACYEPTTDSLGYKSEHCEYICDCKNCKGTGSITQEFTIKELIEGDYLK